MAGDMTDVGTTYSSPVGLVFIFNLIVGTGALTMPKAFHEAGWLLSLILVIVLAFTSFLTVTFVVESMAIANALSKAKVKKDVTISLVNEQIFPVASASDDNDEVFETTPILSSHGRDRSYANLIETDIFDITERIEMGQMARLFFNKVGLNIFYICIIVYLFGDLAIYAAAVPKSLMDVSCTYYGNVSGNSSICNVTLTDNDPCWSTLSLTRSTVYRLYVVLFTLSLGPFMFFNIQKTKYLQLFTTAMRWTAFIIMIVFAVMRLAKGEGKGHPDVVNFAGIPNLFGVCVYSFMCHHSLPSLVTPIRNKTKLTNLFAADFLLILAFYCLLSFTGIFAFSQIEDLYTLNFKPNHCNTKDEAISLITVLDYFLTLFPVFTLSTNFPIIGITLRNNLKAIFYKEDRQFPFVVDRIILPLVAALPPVGVALATSDLSYLVGITGSYAGAAIQYIVPACLVFYGRKDILNTLGPVKNKHGSLFKHVIWVILIISWAILAIVLVTVNHIITRK